MTEQEINDTADYARQELTNTYGMDFRVKKALIAASELLKQKDVEISRLETLLDEITMNRGGV